MILIFYAFIVLTAIYTYQFSYISDLWKDALNSSHSELSVDEMYAYVCIGNSVYFRVVRE